MSKDQLLIQYEKDVENIRKSAKNLGLSENEFNKLIKDSINNINEQTKCSKPAAQKFKLALKIASLFTLFCISIYVLLNVHQTTSSIVLRNVQGFIYPGLKTVRYLSVPIIKLFPSLTDLYDESCLVENPFFFVSDMECWPCEEIYSVIDLTNIKDIAPLETGAPFITKTNQRLITYSYLKDHFTKNKAVLLTDQRRFTSTNKSITNLEHLFTLNDEDIKLSNLHAVWRVNKMDSARVLRKIFTRPNFISEWSGQSVERFIIVDGSSSEPYVLPNTECSYIFVIQASGERTIILKPSNECSKNCRTISVNLKESYVLWYNWWYWRPISLPVENSTETSITYINSYC